MTDMTIPDGRPPRKLTVKDKMDARDKAVAESKMRGVVSEYVAPDLPWALYTRGAGSAFATTGYVRVGGFSLQQGGHPSISFNSSGQEWTVDAGTWVIKASLRYNSGSSAGILSVTNSQSTPDNNSFPASNVYPGGQTAGINIANRMAAVVCFDWQSATASVFDVWQYITNSGSTAIQDSSISFHKIG